MEFLKLIYDYVFWNTDGFNMDLSYKKPSFYSIQEFLENNYEDLLNFKIYSSIKEKFLLESKELRYKEITKKLEKFYDSIIQKSDTNLYDFHRTRDIDKNAWIFVESLLKSEGWLVKSKIGDKANTALFIIVQRQSLNIRERWIEELKKSVDKFESPSEFLRMMEDRIQLDLGKSQIYGTQFVQNHSSKYFNVKSKFKNTKDMNKFASKLIGESKNNILKFSEFLLN